MKISTRKKIAFVVVAIVTIAVIVFALFYFRLSENEKRFYKIIKEYDKSYAVRMKEYEDGEILRVYDAQNGSKGFLLVSEGYENTILIFAILDEDSIESVEIIYNNETADYGDLVTKEWFLDRFIIPYNKRIEIVKRKKESENQVVAITGATITSQAVGNAINKCADIMKEIKNEK